MKYKELIILVLALSIIGCASHNKLHVKSDGTFKTTSNIKGFKPNTLPHSYNPEIKCATYKYNLHSISQRVREEQNNLFTQSLNHIGLKELSDNPTNCYKIVLTTSFTPYIEIHNFSVKVYYGNEPHFESSNSNSPWVSYPKELYNLVFQDLNDWVKK